MPKKKYKPEKMQIFGKDNCSHRFIDCKYCGMEFKKYLWAPTAYHNACDVCMDMIVYKDKNNED